MCICSCGSSATNKLVNIPSSLERNSPEQYKSTRFFSPVRFSHKNSNAMLFPWPTNRSETLSAIYLQILLTKFSFDLVMMTGSYSMQLSSKYVVKAAKTTHNNIRYNSPSIIYCGCECEGFAVNRSVSNG